MKKSWNNNRWPLLLVLPLALLLGACQKGGKTPGATATTTPATEATAGDLYTCPMHPQIIRDKPGSCPICGMDLVKKPKDNGAAQAPAGESLQNLLQSPDATVVASQATVHPDTSAPQMSLTLPGRVEYDVRRNEAIAARFGGRVDKLYIRYNYQPVTKGQKLLEVYSPELVTAQQELLFILTNDAENRSLLQGARQKLRLLGLTDGQISQFIRTHQPQYQVAIYSPYTGYVVEQPGLAAAGPAALMPPAIEGMGVGDAMGGSAAAAGSVPSSTMPSSALELKEGSYVTAGQTLFRVVNTEQVWGVFEPRPDELAGLRVGQAIRVVPEGSAGKPITARIDLVEPFFREGQSTGAVRVHLPNPGGRLRSGLLLTGSVQLTPTGGLWLPRTAVVDLGNRQVAFVRANGAFRAVSVETGLRSADRVQVLRGVTAQDRVAANAQFLVDSEGFVQTSKTDYHD
ncbi:efflux RND transporter periplasmic adaptor subunit [Hymenobacter defluvii]|uniref:Efflux RND transporter periplasmic adaptor subunit n=1 Tax=Hymenobacter defluvii TaxID=2054411 RepID=A0ABS3TEJ1_9BACT|nr:efflux RND transporter periplasmic adaptor subunit [Hymenobacter defluvii]MBO3272081.1 efflux RND transporter periplasmic adaptor subunit [Hymenobacter defluvii]